MLALWPFLLRGHSTPLCANKQVGWTGQNLNMTLNPAFAPEVPEEGNDDDGPLKTLKLIPQLLNNREYLVERKRAQTADPPKFLQDRRATDTAHVNPGDSWRAESRLLYRCFTSVSW